MSSLKLIGQGRTAEVYEWEEKQILKLFKANMSKSAVEYEYNVSCELSKKGLPVAKVYDLVEREGRLGIVYERINGVTMMDAISSKPWRVGKEAQRMAELHKAIQSNIEVQMPEQKQRLKESITSAEMLTTDAKSKLYEYIDRLPNATTLCHGDFHPDNILISENKAVVIDWITATKGNPLSDVARTAIMFKHAAIPEEKSYIEKRIINFVRRKFLSKYLETYVSLSGINIEQIEQWELPMAAARLIEGIPHSEKETLLRLVNQKLSLL